MHESCRTISSCFTVACADRWLTAALFAALLPEMRQRLISNHLRELPVVDGESKVIGYLDEAQIAKIHLDAATRIEDPTTPPLGTRIDH